MRGHFCSASTVTSLPSPGEVFFQISPALAAGYVAANFVFGVYHAAWKYGGVRDVFYLAMSVALVTSIAFVVIFFDVAVPRKQIPVSVVLIGGGITFLTMSSTKLWPHLNTVQFAVMINGGQRKRLGKRVLIVGAGDTGQLVAREFLNNPHWEYRPVCFVDDDFQKRGVRIHGIPVAGARDQIPELVQRYRIDAVTLAMSSIPRRSFEEIMQLCRRADVPVNIVPRAVDILGGKIDRAVTVRFRE